MMDPEMTRALDNLAVHMYLTAERLDAERGDPHTPLLDDTAAQLLRDAADILRCMCKLAMTQEALAELQTVVPREPVLANDTGE